MVSRDDNTYVIYPIYFDRSISRLNGRKVSQKHAVEKPLLENLAKAAKSLGLNPIIEKNAAYASTPWKRDGRIRIAKKGSKSKLLLQIANRL